MIELGKRLKQAKNLPDKICERQRLGELERLKDRITALGVQVHVEFACPTEVIAVSVDPMLVEDVLDIQLIKLVVDDPVKGYV